MHANVLFKKKQHPVRTSVQLESPLGASPAKNELLAQLLGWSDNS